MGWWCLLPIKRKNKLSSRDWLSMHSNYPPCIIVFVSMHAITLWLLEKRVCHRLLALDLSCNLINPPHHRQLFFFHFLLATTMFAVEGMLFISSMKICLSQVFINAAQEAKGRFCFYCSAWCMANKEQH